VPTTWKCAECGRAFARKSQRHACGTGDLRHVLRHRDPALVALYRALESFAKSLGPIEVVARERYVLMRTVRIFADLVIMKDALRVEVHLSRTVNAEIFFKSVHDDKGVTHVAKLTNNADIQAIEPYLKEAYEHSLTERTKALR
jgi:hypothetical protein